MITCEPRMPAYDAALKQAVQPGSHVIDIGAGTGIFSLLACKYGAAQVTAIEPADEVLLTRDLAVANGCDDRITVMQGLSTNHVTAQKADVIVSDIRGTMPLFEHHIATIVDARERLLAPGGTLIPMRDTIRAVLVNAPDEYKHVTDPWINNRYDLDLTAGYRYAANNMFKVYVDPDAMVSDVQVWAVLDYRTISDPNMVAKVTLTPIGDVTAHGLLLWFDAELAEGIGYSNAPGEPKLVYGQSFFPFEQLVTVSADDRVEAEVKASLVDGGYVWSWTTSIYRGAAQRPETVFRQSTFKSQVLSPASLAKKTGQHVPPPSPKHQIDMALLSLIDGTRTMTQIADQLRSRFPQAVPTAKAALDLVATAVGRYDENG